MPNHNRHNKQNNKPKGYIPHNIDDIFNSTKDIIYELQTRSNSSLIYQITNDRDLKITDKEPFDNIEIELNSGDIVLILKDK